MGTNKEDKIEHMKKIMLILSLFLVKIAFCQKVNNGIDCELKYYCAKVKSFYPDIKTHTLFVECLHQDSLNTKLLITSTYYHDIDIAKAKKFPVYVIIDNNRVYLDRRSAKYILQNSPFFDTQPSEPKPESNRLPILDSSFFAILKEIDYRPFMMRIQVSNKVGKIDILESKFSYLYP